MKKEEKKRFIKDIYNAAKKEWKQEKKQKVIEFYLKEELKKELEEGPERYYELKVYCNQFSDVGDIQVLVAMLSVLIGYVSDFDKGSIIICVLLLSIISIYLPIPYKKCKFVLDNIEQCELEEIMVKKEKVSRNDKDERNEKEHINDMIGRIEELKQTWLKKKISLIELGEKAEALVEELKRETDYSKVKGYVENIIILDQNVENSKAMISNTTLAFVAVMLTINSLFLAKNEIEILSYIYFGVAFLFMVGIILVFCFTIKKHIGKYAREKSFYEILEKYMD